ncbi:MAG: polysaccharide export outer membrane protein [Granulosicoccus sp.]|jgi:polysaccharide export outer membrane protein
MIFITFFTKKIMRIFISWIKLGLIILLCGTFFISCVKHSELISLNGEDKEIKRGDKVIDAAVYNELHNYEAYKVQPFDQLMIKVNAFDGSTEEYLNREFAAENVFSREISYDPASLYFNSYTVDEEGHITLPLIGDVKISAKTIADVKKQLDKAYKPHLKLVSTSVKLANMRVTVFGEVNRPGVHYLYNERNTLLDAISMAGDITDFGNRTKVKLIRMTEEGSETVFLDLSRSGFISTEFYYVQPYDVIYIEPTKFKSRDRSSRVAGLVVSAISAGAVILSFFIPR